VVAKKLGGLSSELSQDELANKILKPFTIQINRNKQVKILTIGFLEKVDFHALPWKNDILFSHKNVVYGLDMPVNFTEVKQPSKDSDKKGRALIVADPRGDLPSARDEAVLVKQILNRNAHWNIESLVGKDVSYGNLRNELEMCDLFHYAGHAHFKGQLGWDSSLRLYSHNEFRLGDIIALKSVPKTVVLLGCETARTNKVFSGLGLAQAFVIAGAKKSIAAVRPLKDRLATDIALQLYEKIENGAIGIREVLLEIKAKHPNSDWASVREIVP